MGHFSTFPLRNTLMLEARFTRWFLVRLHSEMKLYEARSQVIILREDSTLFGLGLISPLGSSWRSCRPNSTPMAWVIANILMVKLLL